jgi:hypothetical protein
MQNGLRHAWVVFSYVGWRLHQEVVRNEAGESAYNLNVVRQ